MNVLLSPPTMQYKDSYIDAWREFIAEHVFPPWNLEMMDRHFDEFIDTLKARENDPMPGYVPQTDFWLIVDGVYTGTINIRHYLTPSLERFGGHIGYKIRPSLRKKGYGTIQCRLALDEARKLGLERVLITCDDSNIGSQKIIEACGGVLQDKIENGRKGGLTRRYWVTL